MAKPISREHPTLDDICWKRGGRSGEYGWNGEYNEQLCRPF